MREEELEKGMKVRVKSNTFLAKPHEEFEGKIVTIQDPNIPKIKEFPEEDKWIPASKLERISFIPEEYFQIE